MKESLVSKSLKRFKSNMSSYISVGVLCALFLVLVSMFSFVHVGIFVFAFAILALPFLFASHISCYLLEIDESINLRAFSRYFISFFRPQFRGSFRGIISFLKTLAIYAGILFIASFITYSIFSNKYGDVFVKTFNEAVKLYYASESYEELMNVLHENDDLLLTFAYYTAAIPIPFAVIGFIYFSSFSSISVYYRANINHGAPSLIRIALANAYSSHGHQMRKDWLKLNWPILALPIIGTGIAVLIYFLAVKNAYLLTPTLMLGALIPLVFFLPFYFPNMEVLYHHYENAFKEGNRSAVETILRRIQESIELTEEEKRNLEESFKNDNEEKE